MLRMRGLRRRRRELRQASPGAGRQAGCAKRQLDSRTSGAAPPPGIEPPLGASGRGARRRGLDLPHLPPPMCQAAVLFNKGDAAGLAALAEAASNSAERLALEWASLRADAHPSFASLAAFFGAHPSWPSSEWIRGRQEAELAAHAETPAKVAAYFASAPPESSAGEIAAARAAGAAGRADEAAQIIRALWRDGNFERFTESVIIREFGSSLTQADHKYRADRLFYAGCLRRRDARRCARRFRCFGAR